MTIHIQTWSGSMSARITDMTNAGKRGKRCRTIRFQGTALGYACGNPLWQLAGERTNEIIGRLQGLATETSFDDALTLVSRAVDVARIDGIGDTLINYEVETGCRGIDAPKPLLTAGNDKWSGSADESGISLRDNQDQYNEPRQCTHRQTHAEAYRLAAKVWEQVQQAETMHQASDILSAAGCKLHYWCAVD